MGRRRRCRAARRSGPAVGAHPPRQARGAVEPEIDPRRRVAGRGSRSRAPHRFGSTDWRPDKTWWLIAAGLAVTAAADRSTTSRSRPARARAWLDRRAVARRRAARGLGGAGPAGPGGPRPAGRHATLCRAIDVRDARPAAAGPPAARLAGRRRAGPGHAAGRHGSLRADRARECRLAALHPHAGDDRRADRPAQSPPAAGETRMDRAAAPRTPP